MTCESRNATVTIQNCIIVADEAFHCMKNSQALLVFLCNVSELFLAFRCLVLAEGTTRHCIIFKYWPDIHRERSG